jgi:hypothetical protein
MTQHDETAVRIVPTLSRLSLKAVSQRLSPIKERHEKYSSCGELAAGALAQFSTIGLSSKGCFQALCRFSPGVPGASRFELQR